MQGKTHDCTGYGRAANDKPDETLLAADPKWESTKVVSAEPKHGDGKVTFHEGSRSSQEGQEASAKQKCRNNSAVAKGHTGRRMQKISISMRRHMCGTLTSFPVAARKPDADPILMRKVLDGISPFETCSSRLAISIVHGVPKRTLTV